MKRKTYDDFILCSCSFNEFIFHFAVSPNANKQTNEHNNKKITRTANSLDLCRHFYGEKPTKRKEKTTTPLRLYIQSEFKL